MSEIKRRGFLKWLGSVALVYLSERDFAATKPPMPQRVLGRTGVKVPALGLGFGPIGTGLGEKEAIELMEAAVELGVTYWDAAPNYGRAQEYIGKFLPKVRDKVFLVSKTATDEAKRALEIVERSLRTMKADRIDLVHVHNIGDFSLDRVLGKGGVLEGLREAQKRGWVRFIGVSGHHRPSVMAKALDSGEFDVVMCVLNFVDRFTYDFENKVLPIARKHKVGIVAMKVMGAPQKGYGSPNQGKLADYADLAIRYSLDLPDVACAVVGAFTIDELEQNATIARSRKSLTKFELRKIAEVGKELSQKWGAHFGAPD